MQRTPKTGNVSRYVAAWAPCPVVVVREETTAVHREIAVGVRDPEDVTGTLAFAFAWLSRVATFVFIIAYTALDSIGGFGVGRTMIVSKKLAADGTITPDQLKGVARVIDTVWIDPVVGGVGSFISHTGSWAVFFATVGLALALVIAKKMPWPPLIPLVGFGWELQVSHASPHGPIAFGLLLVATLWMGWAQRRAA